MQDPALPAYTSALLGARDIRRGEHSHLRYAMLRGEWGAFLEKALKAHAWKRRTSWGPQDQASNVFRSIATEIGGVPYLTEPTVEAPAGGDALTGPDGVLERGGFWPLMQGACEDLVGLREIGMRLAYTSEGGLVAEPIPPHLMTAKAHAWAPLSPHSVGVLDIREHPQHGPIWAREEWDASDPMAPSYRIVDVARNEDVTQLYARIEEDGTSRAATSGDMSGESYPWRWTQGERKNKPFIPVPIYHAQRRATLWDAWYGVEAVAGSLTLAVLHTFWVHCLRDGSIATMAVIDGVPMGVTVETVDGEQEPISWVAIEAGAFNLFRGLEGKTPQLVQLQPQARPLEMIQALQAFEARVAVYAGVSSSDLTRQSGDPRSGYALSVSSEGKRRASLRLSPQLRAGDRESLEISAALVNISTGSAIPESGYRPSYGTLPVSIEERQEILRYVTDAVDRRLMSRRDAVRTLRPDLTEAGVTAYLAQIDADRAAASSALTL